MPGPKSATAPRAAAEPDSKSRLLQGHHSPAALAARRANLLKARAAPRERIYRPTEKRRAASRRNLERALAARRSCRGNDPTRMNAVKHGLFAHEFSPATLRRLGEDPGEFRELQRLLRRLLAPRERPEKELVRRLGETCWRRLRLFRACARREQESLRKALASVPPARGPLGPDESELRAQILGVAIFDLTGTVGEAFKLQSQIECLLRALLRKRSSGADEFRMVSPRRESRITEVESLSMRDKPLSDMTDAELDERLRYFRFDHLMKTASRQSAEQEFRDLEALLSGLE